MDPGKFKKHHTTVLRTITPVPVVSRVGFDGTHLALMIVGGLFLVYMLQNR